MILKTIVYVDMDDVIADFMASYVHSKLIKPDVEFPQGEIGFFENLFPVEGAIDAVNELRNRSELEVYILTAPSVKNTHSYNEKRIWVEKYFDYEFCKNLIICGNKSLLIGDYLIDDNVSGKGQESFNGDLIHYSSAKYPNWESIKNSSLDIFK